MEPATDQPPFWKQKSLAEMSEAEWESLCDGCGWCCLYKIEDEDTHEVFYTNIACRLLDPYSCRCRSYANRFKLVETCIQITVERAMQIKWLPETCAYRRLAEGKDLPAWHPLISGDPEAVHNELISVRGKIIPEQMINMDNLEDYILDEDEII